MVLDLPTLADIMLGTVDNWNHTAIRSLNPNIAQVLPNASIIVVTPTNSPSTVQLFTEALSGVSSSFRDQVRRTPEFVISQLETRVSINIFLIPTFARLEWCPRYDCQWTRWVVISTLLIPSAASITTRIRLASGFMKTFDSKNLLLWQIW